MTSSGCCLSASLFAFVLVPVEYCLVLLSVANAADLLLSKGVDVCNFMCLSQAISRACRSYLAMGDVTRAKAVVRVGKSYLRIRVCDPVWIQ